MAMPLVVLVASIGKGPEGDSRDEDHNTQGFTPGDLDRADDEKNGDAQYAGKETVS
jgi:hypothetical protein